MNARSYCSAGGLCTLLLVFASIGAAGDIDDLIPRSNALNRTDMFYGSAYFEIMRDPTPAEALLRQAMQAYVQLQIAHEKKPSAQSERKLREASLAWFKLETTLASTTVEAKSAAAEFLKRENGL